MSAQEQLEMLLSATAYDSSGTKIGSVRQVYLDDSTGRATFATVTTGIFSADAIIPLFGARLLDRELHLDFTKATIAAAPRFDHTEDSLTPEQEVDLLEHFDITTDGEIAAPSEPASEDERADFAETEPGTIPARRLASVEEPPEGSAENVTQ